VDCTEPHAAVGIKMTFTIGNNGRKGRGSQQRSNQEVSLITKTVHEVQSFA